jgi:hypothetical protein
MFAIHREGGYSSSKYSYFAPGRTGAIAYFPRAEILYAGGGGLVPHAIHDDKPPPKLILLSRDRGSALLAMRTSNGIQGRVSRRSAAKKELIAHGDDGARGRGVN